MTAEVVRRHIAIRHGSTVGSDTLPKFRNEFIQIIDVSKANIAHLFAALEAIGKNIKTLCDGLKNHRMLASIDRYYGRAAATFAIAIV